MKKKLNLFDNPTKKNERERYEEIIGYWKERCMNAEEEVRQLKDERNGDEGSNNYL